MPPPGGPGTEAVCTVMGVVVTCLNMPHTITVLCLSCWLLGLGCWAVADEINTVAALATLFGLVTPYTWQ
jgi:hypothetical protein